VILLGGFIWEVVMAYEAREIILAEHKWFCRQIPWIFASGFMFGWLIKTLDSSPKGDSLGHKPLWKIAPSWHDFGLDQTTR
jgi:hypothetical protein